MPIIIIIIIIVIIIISSAVLVKINKPDHTDCQVLCTVKS